MFSELIDVVYSYYELNQLLFEISDKTQERDKQIFDLLTKQFIPLLSEQFRDEICKSDLTVEDFEDLILVKCLTIRSVISQVIKYSPKKALKYKELIKQLITSVPSM